VTGVDGWSRLSRAVVAGPAGVRPADLPVTNEGN
jgi:hypothetical protein